MEILTVKNTPIVAPDTLPINVIEPITPELKPIVKERLSGFTGP